MTWSLVAIVGTAAAAVYVPVLETKRNTPESQDSVISLMKMQAQLQLSAAMAGMRVDESSYKGWTVPDAYMSGLKVLDAGTMVRLDSSCEGDSHKFYAAVEPRATRRGPKGHLQDVLSGARMSWSFTNRAGEGEFTGALMQDGIWLSGRNSIEPAEAKDSFMNEFPGHFFDCEAKAVVSTEQMLSFLGLQAHYAEAQAGGKTQPGKMVWVEDFNRLAYLSVTENERPEMSIKFSFGNDASEALLKFKEAHEALAKRVKIARAATAFTGDRDSLRKSVDYELAGGGSLRLGLENDPKLGWVTTLAFSVEHKNLPQVEPAPHRSPDAPSAAASQAEVAPAVTGPASAASTASVSALR